MLRDRVFSGEGHSMWKEKCGQGQKRRLYKRKSQPFYFGWGLEEGTTAALIVLELTEQYRCSRHSSKSSAHIVTSFDPPNNPTEWALVVVPFS